MGDVWRPIRREDRLSSLTDQGLSDNLRCDAAAVKVRRDLILIWLCGLALLAGVIALSWNGNPYWMDAGGYASIIAADGWVVHPPGHILFVAAARLLHASAFADCVVSASVTSTFPGNPKVSCQPLEVASVFANSYTALQLLTLLLTLAGMLSLYRLLREVLDSRQSSLLVFVFLRCLGFRC